jgi:ABC-type antimicrobial peptide transport system permease subunit
MLSELRRRRGRTILTALGLGVGIGLVITVSGLSSGLDRAQASVLKPLTGVGTDMSATKPIAITRSADGGPPQISAEA